MSFIQTRIALIVAAAAVCLAPSALAATATVKLDVPSVPASPAFVALGVSPTTVLRPSSVRGFGADVVPQLLDSDLRFKPGLAIEVAPIWLLVGSNTTLQDWRASYGKRLASRFSFSFATRGAFSEESTDGGIAEGFRLVLWEPADPRWNTKLEKCIGEALDPASDPSAPPTSINAIPDKTEIVDNADILSCKAQHAAGFSNSPGAMIALALTQETADGDIKKLEMARLFVWASLAVAFGGQKVTIDGHTMRQHSVGSLVVSARYRADFATSESELAIGAQVRVGTERLSGSVDFAWTPRFGGDTGTATRDLVVGGAGELRVAKGVYVVVSGGGEFGGDADSAGPYARLGVRVGEQVRELVNLPGS